LEQNPREFNILEARYKLIKKCIEIIKQNFYMFRASVARLVVFQNIKTLLMGILLN